MNIRHVVLILSPPIMLIGCRSRSAQAPGHDAEKDSLRVMLVAELGTRIRGDSSGGVLDSTYVTYGDARSASVRGLTYHVAAYQSPRYSHGLRSVVVGTRGGAIVPIRAVADWERLSGNWIPANVEEAVSACTELAKYAFPGGNPGLRLVVYSGPLVLDSVPVIPRSLLAGIALTPPVVTRDTANVWSVEMWTFEPHRTNRYQCKFSGGATMDRGRVTLVRIDSILGVGIPAP